VPRSRRAINRATDTRGVSNADAESAPLTRRDAREWPAGVGSRRRLAARLLPRTHRDVDPVVDIFFEEAAELLADFEAGLLELEGTQGEAELLHRIFRAAHTIKGNAAMLGFDAIARFTHGLESLLDALRTGGRPVTAEIVDALLVSGDVLRRMLRSAQTGGETDDVERTLERLLALRDVEDVEAGPSRSGGTAPAEPAMAAAGATTTASIRVPIAKVDRLINLVGELVITQAMVAQAAAALPSDQAAALADAVSHMDRHARELHEQVLALRMLPVRSLFSRFPRVVRDVAASLGKQATLEVSGEDTELDRTVIERISDPLTHLVRNAVDHGLETPDERAAGGKPVVGRLLLTAYQQGGSIYIEIDDDGRGLDRERILTKAVATGLVGAGQELTDDQVWALVFHPGFSTAARLTEVSGRGVGMDVVRRNVEALGGTITIQTTRGQGTRFRIKLPLTLAIMEGQALRVGEQQYILPLIAIRETVRPTRGTIHTIGPGAELALVHGEALPILRLHRLFAIPGAAEDPTHGLLVVVEHDGDPAALLVDELLGQQQVVIKSLDTDFTKVRGIAGATILGDGRVALILDVAGIVHCATAARPPLRAVA
jgi:two-component system chemotaxis sensor kinase CheA